jgi:hypothetical protein
VAAEKCNRHSWVVLVVPVEEGASRTDLAELVEHHTAVGYMPVGSYRVAVEAEEGPKEEPLVLGSASQDSRMGHSALLNSLVGEGEEGGSTMMTTVAGIAEEAVSFRTVALEPLGIADFEWLSTLAIQALEEESGKSVDLSMFVAGNLATE